jgi:hypothetical protein
VIISNLMSKLLKKEHHGLLAQLCSLYVQTCRSFVLVDLQIVINNHFKVFREMPKGIPPTRDRYHAIHLQPRSVQPNIRPYRYPYVQKSEIERIQ